MKEYIRYSLQVRKEHAWFDYFINPSLDLIKHKLNQAKEEKWEWNPDFRVVERFIIEKVVTEEEIESLK